MKATIFTCLSLSLSLLSFTGIKPVQASKDGLSPYHETIRPLHDSREVSEDDPHVKIVDWHPDVPLGRILNAIQEGSTTQLTILKLFSAPNIITRDPKLDKEVWIYHWLWSYRNEQDPNQTLILMDRPGKRIKKHDNPVSMEIVFNQKDIVESYQVKMLKIKNDYFDSK